MSMKLIMADNTTTSSIKEAIDWTLTNKPKACVVVNDGSGEILEVPFTHIDKYVAWAGRYGFFFEHRDSPPGREFERVGTLREFISTGHLWNAGVLRLY